MDSNSSLDSDSLAVEVEGLVDRMVEDHDFAVYFLWTIRDLWTPEFKAWLDRSVNCSGVSGPNPEKYPPRVHQESPGDPPE